MTKTTFTLEDIRAMLQSKPDDLRLFSTATDALDTSMEGVWAGVILDVDDPAALARRIIVGRDVDYSDYPPLALTDNPDKHVDWDVIMDGVQAALEGLLALDVDALDAMADNHSWITVDVAFITGKPDSGGSEVVIKNVPLTLLGEELPQGAVPPA